MAARLLVVVQYVHLSLEDFWPSADYSQSFWMFQILNLGWTGDSGRVTLHRYFIITLERCGRMSR